MILRFRAVIFVLCTSGIRALHEWYSCFARVIFVLCTSGIRALHEWYSRLPKPLYRPKHSTARDARRRRAERRSFGYFPSLLKESNVKNLVSFVFSCRARKTKRAHLSIENKCAQTVGYINFCFMWASPRGIMASVPFVQAPTAKKFHFPSVAEILKIHNIILPQTSQNVKYFLLIPAPKFDNIFSFFRPAVSIFHKAHPQDFSTVVFSLTARAIMRSITRQISVPAA